MRIKTCNMVNQILLLSFFNVLLFFFAINGLYMLKITGYLFESSKIPILFYFVMINLYFYGLDMLFIDIVPPSTLKMPRYFDWLSAQTLVPDTLGFQFNKDVLSLFVFSLIYSFIEILLVYLFLILLIVGASLGSSKIAFQDAIAYPFNKNGDSALRTYIIFKSIIILVYIFFTRILFIPITILWVSVALAILIYYLYSRRSANKRIKRWKSSHPGGAGK